MRIRIRRLHPHARLPEYQTAGAAAFDLAAAEDAVIAPAEVRLIGTGLVVEVPPGYFLAIVARSSLPIKKQLIVANGVGVVDSDYRGPADEVKVEVLNVSGAPVTVARGERLAQGLILPTIRVEWEEASASDAPSRGGFGATRGYGSDA
ncbi:MAG: dUTP diphosphatase [Vicinamibacterales bacterium]